MKFGKKIFVALLALTIAASTACVAAACGKKKETAVYSVTVVCADADVLAGVEVSLKSESGEAVESGGPKALTEGKATFTLPAATYRVALSNVPEGYLWDPAWVSEDRPSTTVTLFAAEQTVDYTVTVLDGEGAPVAGALITLLSGDTAVKEKLSDARGRAVFPVQRGTYTLRVVPPEGYTIAQNSYTMSEEETSLTLSCTALEPLGVLPNDCRGSWRALTQAVTLFGGERTLLFNAQAVNFYAGEGGAILFWDGAEPYTLTQNEALTGTLLLSSGEESIVLLPENGLPQVAATAELEGTWVLLDENDEVLHTVRLIGTTFALDEASGYLAEIRERTEDGEALLGVAAVIERGDEAGIYFMTYHMNSGLLEIDGFDAAFTKGGEGTISDPKVLDTLAGEHSYALTATSRDVGGFMQQWNYNTVYLSYTAGDEDEDYTLTVGDNDLLFVIARAGSDAEADVLVNWDVSSASSDYVPFTLKAKTQYLITVASGRSSRQKLPPCTMTFTILEGTVSAPARQTIPAEFHGVWYNKTDDNDRIVIAGAQHPWGDDTAVWKGEAMRILSAEDGVLTASLSGKTWTFTREEATLTAVCDGESVLFSLLSSDPHSAPIPAAYGGLWICDGSRSPSGKTEYIYILPLTYRGVGEEAEIVDDGAFYWMGRAAIVTDASLFGLTIVMDDHVYTGSYSYAAGLTVTKEDGSESYLFTAPEQSQYVNDFSAVAGTWTSNGYTLTAEKDRFLFNGTTLAGLDEEHPDEEGNPTEVASKVVLLDGKLTFCVEGRFYTLAAGGGGLVLTILNTGESVTLVRG